MTHFGPLALSLVASLALPPIWTLSSEAGNRAFALDDRLFAETTGRGAVGLVRLNGTEPVDPLQPEDPTRSLLREWGQEPPVGGASDETGSAEDDTATEETTEVSPLDDQCASLSVDGSKWIDRVNRGLHRAVCESALWFDNLFGDPRVREDDREATYGRILLGLHADERDGLEDFTNFEANVSFPKMERRLNAFVGRGDRERIVTGQSQAEEFVPPMGLQDDDEWLIGLGYSPARGRRSKTSFDVGVDLGFPMNPFVRARYRHRFFPGDRSLVRIRPALFWEREEGVGMSTKIDYDRLIGDDLLFRWRNVGIWTEQSRGLEWYLELTLFQNLGIKRALGYQLGSLGEGDDLVPVREHFARVIYRQQFAREWLYLDIRPGLAFRRQFRDESREVVPFLSFGVEMVFGDRPGVSRRARAAN